MELSDSRINLAAKALVVFLVALGLLTVAAAVMEGHLAALPEGLLFVYLGVVLAFGLFRGELEAPGVQIAFGLGIVAYGLLIYAREDSMIWLLVAILAALLVGRNLLYLRK